MTEYVLENIKDSLTTYLPNELINLQMYVSSSIATPVPQEFKIGEIDSKIVTNYPTVAIWSPYSRKKTDIKGFQNREVWFRVLSWIVDNDVSNLHKFVCRYTDAIAKILRNETYWNSNLHNAVIEESQNTDLYETNVGYAQGALLEGTIDYILV